MTPGELTGLLSADFYENFADQIASQVVDAGAVGVLYALITAPEAKHRILFRGAYVLERIYFRDSRLFEPHVEAFCRHDFAACRDASARRHFGKMMAHLLRDYTPPAAWLDAIAESAAQWAVEPDTKVAVRIWAVEVLKCCREKVPWVAQTWDDLMGAMEADSTPGIACRMRKSWK